jgi:hypothetical protein
MFFVADHSVGGFPLGATPVASGPRHWCQLVSFCSSKLAAASVALEKQSIALQKIDGSFVIARSSLKPDVRRAKSYVAETVGRVTYLLLNLRQNLWKR